MAKRTLDILVSAIVLALLAPALLLLAAAIRLDSPGPVFYRGRRVGLNGKVFEILKLRTMVADAEKRGGSSTAQDDARITRMGRVIRRNKLDEIPQFINVLQGDMSLVGPRPEVSSEQKAYQGDYARILEMRPGITDWASIWNRDEGAALAGCRDPHTAYQQCLQPTKLQLQLKYVDTSAFHTDLRILLATCATLIRPNWVPIELKEYPSPRSLILRGGYVNESADDNGRMSSSRRA